MKLGGIINCVCLSCGLMYFYVSSQPSCSRGWFGHQCKYKCRCENTSCDVNGSCIQPYTCEGGWFGPACQYADLAYSPANVIAVTDGKDHTCNDPNAYASIIITFNESFVFFWLRIHVRDQGSDDLRNLTLALISNGNLLPCPIWRKHAVNKTILDMHCDLSQTINKMTMTGTAVPHLCSVYVSGGRNVAVKESTWQASDYVESNGGTTVHFDASRAVDGDTHQRFYDMSCSHTDNTNTWIVTLSRQRSVHKYVIYNRSDAGTIRLMGFTLESFDSMNRSVFIHEDKTTQARLIYTIVHSPIPVQIVVVTAFNSQNILTLCEVEIYGDSICDSQHYGRDCEHACSCVDSETCFVSTGGCPLGCPTGFHGDSCMDACPAGKLGNFCNLTCSDNCQPFQNGNTSACYNNAVCQTHCKAGYFGPLCNEYCNVEKFGINCNQSCSPNCVPSGQVDVSSCNIKTGVCIKGCQSGFSGAFCRQGCIIGTFGLHCNQSCSPHCVPYKQKGVSPCNNKTGACLKGCLSGFTGDLCRDGISETPSPFANVHIALILSLCVILAVFLVLVCMWRQYKKPTQGEAVNAQHERANTTRKTSNVI